MRYLAVVLFSIITISSRGQQTFNLLYDNLARTELSYSSIELPDSSGYLVSGVSFSGSYDALHIIKIDTGGSVTDTLVLQLQGKSWFPENIIEVSDGNYMVTGTLFQSNPYDGDFFAFKISPDLDSLWLNEYEFRTGNEGCKKIKELNDGGFVLIGYSQTFPNNDGQNYIFKIDNSGIREWELIHGDSTHNEEPQDVLQLPDSTILVLSWRVYPNDDNILLLKLTPDGKLIWEKEIPSSRLNIGSVMIPISDSRIMIGGISRVSVNGKSKAYGAMIDTAGNLKWEKLYGGTESGWFADGDLVDGGHVVFAGNQSGNETYQGNRDGYVVKMDTSGNVVWSRIVNPMGEFEHDYNDYFYGVLATSDGGILGTGFTGKGHISNTQDAWIMKLDSEGLCDTPTCYPWLVTVLPNPERTEVKVWPNPATDLIQLLLPEPTGLISLHNLQGVRVLEQKVHSRHSRLQFADLPVGLYLLNWTVDGEVRETRKIVIQR